VPYENTLNRTEKATGQWQVSSYSRPSVGWITETLGRQFPRTHAWDLVVPLVGTAIVASYVDVQYSKKKVSATGGLDS